MALVQKLEELTSEEIQEMPLVDIAHEILSGSNEPFYYRDLMNKVAEWRGMSAKEVTDSIARLYTDVNIDGRFLCIGDNVWGLRRWYPVEKLTERSSAKRFVRKELDDSEDVEDLEDDFELEEELIEEEPFVFEDGENIDEDNSEEDMDFLEESETEELEVEDEDEEDSEEF